MTLTDVALRAGVSQPTASRVLNGSARTPGPAIVEAVRKAAEELGYIPNAQAQALARASTALMGLVVQDIADPYFSSIAAGVQGAAIAERRQMMIAATQRDPAQEVAIVEAFIAHRADVIVLAGSRWTTPQALDVAGQLELGLSRYIRNGGRVAVIGQPVPGAHAVVPSNRAGAAALARALIDQGLRTFAVLAGPAQMDTAVHRTAGFVEAVSRAGLALPPTFDGEFTRDGGFEAARRAITDLRPGIEPVCLFAVNDVMAMGAVAAVREAGLRIPEEVQLAGFDDIPTLRDFRPALSTVRLPLEQMGRRAVELAMRDDHPPVIERIRGTVFLRESTGAPGS